MNDQIHSFVATLRSLFIGRRDEKGASAVEYGLLVAGIAAMIVAVVFLFGGMVSKVFNDTCSTIQAGGNEATADCAPDTGIGGDAGGDPVN